ncbi:MAG TPA: 4-hydroxy-3-methylbut-2-enyl diphosphate reductase [Luteolibacter sp.]|nr:4-hydroxy-3-methylbut-2-enyl diphosphate reductase [Luteolibacter sp.]
MDPETQPTGRARVNVRRPDVMELVSAQIATHYHSSLVQKLRDGGGKAVIGNTTLLLAEQFGFCYGVERAIDLAYASRRVFPDQRILLIGEIIHNPDVNRQLADMGIRSLPWQQMDASYEDLGPDDVVIVPAFGAPTEFMNKLDEKGCYIVDTTCGDVMKVWRRVRSYARDGVTSIIHGKASHEETRATASRALGEKGDGHYVVILTLEDTAMLCGQIRNGVDKAAFMQRFGHACSPGFDPERHLVKLGIANQTTMLKSETEQIQRLIRDAVIDRDGNDANFQMFDTICGATQERQDALFTMLKQPMDALFVVGGYNSSNTTHLVEIAQQSVPTFFIRGASCIRSFEEILHYDLEHKREISGSYSALLDPTRPATIGITAGASCPNNLIEESLKRLLTLRGANPSDLDASQT